MGRIVAEEGRYSAGLTDGSLITGTQIQNWNDEKQRPSMNGKPVFDDKNPFRWLINHSLSPASEPAAFVEFFGGDRLPGQVAGYRSGRESAYITLPKHLVIDPDVPLNSPQFPQNSKVRINTEWLKRVVWQPRSLDLYDPGNVFLKDGRQIPFRSLRWSNDSVTLLLDEGIQEVFFNDLMEIHFPLPDVWSVYYQQMAVLSPQSALSAETHARIIQLETMDGLKATVSTMRMKPFVHGNKNATSSWHHQCQPAWSLDPFWVRFDSVWSRRFFWPHQMPLTYLTPVSVRQDSPLGSSWYWQRDRNVHKQSLQSGGKDFGWGFGVHAFHELVLPLPTSATGFRTRAGLDQSVGEGGCVRWQVTLRNKSEKRLYQSPVVSGTSQVLDTGRLALAAPVDPAITRELVLSVDPLLDGAPAGTDPLDIRDSLNWLEPELELNKVQLREAIAKQAMSQVPTLADWRVETNSAESLVLNSVWEEFDRQDPRYRLMLGSRGRFLSLSKTLSIGSKDHWLSLAVNRSDAKAPPVTVQVHIDGSAIAELEIPPMVDARGPDPLLIPVDAYQGRSVNVRLVQFPAPEASAPKTPQEELAFCVDWRGIATSEHRPGLLPLLKENQKFLELLAEGDGTLELDKTDPYAGPTSVKVTPTERGQSKLPQLEVAIRSTPRLGEYRYIAFAWKKQDGNDIALGLAHHGELGGDNVGIQRPRIRRDPNLLRGKAAKLRRPLESNGRGLQYGYRYSRGRGNPDIGAALKIDRSVPKDWQWLNRDLFNDFGDFTLTGFSLLCPDGNAAWFDEIYLARDPRDFAFLPSREKPVTPHSDANILQIETDPDRYGLASQKVLGPFAVSNISEGVQLLKEYQGESNVIRTMPRDQKTPCVLRAPVVLPAKQKCRLELEVNRHPEGDWKLIVTANGEKLNDTLISKANAGEKWLAVSVDLSKFAGQPVMLEIQNAPNNWHYEAAYWNRVAIVNE